MANANASTGILVKVRYKSHEDTVVLDKSHTTAALAGIIWERTNIPTKDQKLIVAGIGLIKPGLDFRPVQDLQGKRIILMGRPVGKAPTEPLTDGKSTEEQARALSAAAEQRLHRRMERAEDELSAHGPRFHTIEEALNGRLQTEELEEGEVFQPLRGFGRLVTNLEDCTPRGCLERLIGMNVIPRLRCCNTWNPCSHSRRVFILEWLHLVQFYLNLCLEATRCVIRNRRPNSEEMKLFRDLNTYQEDLVHEQDLWQRGSYTFTRGVIWFLVGEMIQDLQLKASSFRIANGNEDGCLADIDSFFMVLSFLSGENESAVGEKSFSPMTSADETNNEIRSQIEFDMSGNKDRCKCTENAPTPERKPT